MKVRMNSWHYRLWAVGRESPRRHPPRDLCRYFWHIAIIKVLLPLMVVTFALAGIGTLIWVIWSNLLISGIVVGTSVVAVAILVGLGWLTVKLYDRRKERVASRPPAPPAPPREPSVIWEYLKARKRKFCPLIEVVDDDRLTGVVDD